GRELARFRLLQKEGWMPHILHFLAPRREAALQRRQIPTIAATDFTVRDHHHRSDLSMRLGADEVISIPSEEAKSLRGTLDTAIDTVGGKAQRDLFALVRKGGA